MTNKEILEYMWDSKDWRLVNYGGVWIHIYSTKYKDCGRVATIRHRDARVFDSITDINSLKSVFLDSNNVLRKRRNENDK